MSTTARPLRNFRDAEVVAFGDMPNDADAAAGRFGCMMVTRIPTRWLSPTRSGAPIARTASRWSWWS